MVESWLSGLAGALVEQKKRQQAMQKQNLMNYVSLIKSGFIPGQREEDALSTAQARGITGVTMPSEERTQRGYTPIKTELGERAVPAGSQIPKGTIQAPLPQGAIPLPKDAIPGVDFIRKAKKELTALEKQRNALDLYEKKQKIAKKYERPSTALPKVFDPEKEAYTVLAKKWGMNWGTMSMNKKAPLIEAEIARQNKLRGKGVSSGAVTKSTPNPLDIIIKKMPPDVQIRIQNLRRKFPDDKIMESDEVKAYL